MTGDYAGFGQHVVLQPVPFYVAFVTDNLVWPPLIPPIAFVFGYVPYPVSFHAFGKILDSHRVFSK
jgi:hypothetical protein